MPSKLLSAATGPTPRRVIRTALAAPMSHFDIVVKGVTCGREIGNGVRKHGLEISGAHTRLSDRLIVLARVED